MLNSINQLSCSNPIYKPVFKQSPQITKPNLEINNIGNDSLEALASYNVAQLNLDSKTKNNVLKPFLVPENIDDIKGERIYNSEGKLIEIVDEDERYKTTYRFNDYISYNMIKTDKKTNVIYQQILDDEFLSIAKKRPDGKVFSTDYKNNVPVQMEEYFYSNDKEQSIEYLPEDDKYYVRQHFKTKDGKISRSLIYNNDGKCTDATDYKGLGKISEVNLFDGKPYSIRKTTNEVIENDINIGKIDLTNLNPDDFYNVDNEQLQNLEGKREYYSNGKLEKIVANDGKVYSFNLSGDLTDIKSDGYTIQFDTKEDTICSSFEPDGHRIERQLDNGGTLVTQYSHDNGSTLASVFYENPNTNEHKSAEYKDGKLMSYSDFINDFHVDYDENGNVRDITESY